MGFPFFIIFLIVSGALTLSAILIVNAIKKNQSQTVPAGDLNQMSQLQPELNISPYASGTSQLPLQNASVTAKAQHILELKKNTADERNLIIVVAVILMCIFFIDSFYRTLGGFGSTLLFWSMQFLLIYLFSQKEQKNTRKAFALALPVFAISASFSLFTDSKGYFIQYLTLIILNCMQIMLLSGVEVKDSFSVESVVLMMRHIIGIPIANMSFFFKSFKVPKNSRNGRIRNLFLSMSGLVIALPFVFLLISLLSKADPIFKDMYDRFIENIHIDLTAGRIINDVIWGFFIAIYIGAIVVYNMVENDGEVPIVKQPSLSPVLGFSFTLLLNILLSIFCFIQVRYLFIGAAYNSIIEDIGFAQYARQGFFELCYASSIVFVLAAVVIALCKKNGKNPITIRISVFCMGIFSGLIAVSSIKRMLLYIGEYGLSIKRLNTLFGIGVILACLFWLLLKCIFTKMKLLKTMGVSIVALVTLLSFINFDRMISSYNVNGYMNGELKVDATYFRELSYGSYPDLVKLYDYATEIKRASFSPYVIDKLEKVMNYQYKKYNSRELFTYTFDDIRINSSTSSYPFLEEELPAWFNGWRNP